mgnify:CR=1 FL=1
MVGEASKNGSAAFADIITPELYETLNAACSTSIDPAKRMAAAKDVYSKLSKYVDTALTDAKKMGKTPCFVMGEIHHNPGSLLAGLMLHKIYMDRGVTSYLECGPEFLQKGGAYDYMIKSKKLDSYPENEILVMYAGKRGKVLHGLDDLSISKFMPEFNANGSPTEKTISYISNVQMNQILNSSILEPGKPISLLVGGLHMRQIASGFVNISQNPQGPARVKQALRGIYLLPTNISNTEEVAILDPYTKQFIEQTPGATKIDLRNHYLKDKNIETIYNDCYVNYYLNLESNNKTSTILLIFRGAT